MGVEKDECPNGCYSRRIGHEIPGVYDGVLFWSCPDCGIQWHRWAEGDPYRHRAEQYLKRQGLE